MSAFTLSLIALVAYLLGSIPFGYLLVRIFRSEDIRTVGSGNIGATNVIRSGAKGLGALTFALDALKGFLAVAMARDLILAALPDWPPIAELYWQGSPAMRLDTAASIAALAAVLGHIFPVWLRFKGGKGVATAFGVLLQLAPLAALIGLLVFVVTVLLRSWRRSRSRWRRCCCRPAPGSSIRAAARRRLTSSAARTRRSRQLPLSSFRSS
jgi:glycerol-3-phosphate acyltransferase PlsY